MLFASFSFFAGNVTGSNAVNVFLGLGLPWVLASIYWEIIKVDDSANSELMAKYTRKYAGFGWFKDLDSSRAHYIVPAGDLGISVATFTALALACVGVLLARRKVVGGELGGPNRLRYLSCGLLVSFWLTYILVSSINAYSK